jgi:hypothetical protein
VGADLYTGWDIVNYASLAHTGLDSSGSLSSCGICPASARAPKDWTMEGSPDGSTWTVLDTRTAQTAWDAAFPAPDRRGSRRPAPVATSSDARRKDRPDQDLPKFFARYFTTVANSASVPTAPRDTITSTMNFHRASAWFS